VLYRNKIIFKTKEELEMENKTARFTRNIRFHQRTLKWIADSNGKEGSLSVIDVHLRMIDDFLKTYVHPLYEIRNQFEEVKKKYPDELKAIEQQILAARSSHIQAPGSAGSINITV
jgi:hypothetical protein